MYNGIWIKVLYLRNILLPYILILHLKDIMNTSTPIANNVPERSSKYASKQKKPAKYSPSSPIEEAISKAPAKHSALNALHYRVSHRIEVANRVTRQQVICNETGIVCSLEIPRIPGFIFSFTSPYSSTDNCRLIAQRGFSYLNELDTQILAGVLLSLADSYNLFVFSPSSSSAEKNAILRTAGKIQLINAIRFIEEKINSHNYSYLPRCSFLIDAHLVQGDVESRLLSYLKTLLDAITKPLDTSEYDDNVAPIKTITPSYSKVTDKKMEKEQAAIAKTLKANGKAFKESLALATKNTKLLFKESLIKIKLRDVLINTLTIEMFSLIPIALKDKAIMRLEELVNDFRATQIIATLRMSANNSVELEDFAFTPPPIPDSTSSISNSFQPLKKTIESLSDYWDAYDKPMNADADFFATLPLDAIVSADNSCDTLIRDTTPDIYPPSTSSKAFSSISISISTSINSVINSTSSNSANEANKETEGVTILKIFTPQGNFEVSSLLWDSLSPMARILYKKRALSNSTK